MINWRHQYDEDRDRQEREKTDIACLDPSLTQQQFTEDVDINVIMKKYGVTDGSIPPVALDPSYFGDFTDAIDFRTALDRVKDATDRFNALPADLRNRFGNDPAYLWQWVNNPANKDEAIKLKLLAEIAPPKETTPAPAPAIVPTP